MTKIASFEKWMQTFRADLLSIFQSYKSITVHRSKINTLFKYGKAFCNDISKNTYSADPPNPIQARELRKILTLIISLRKFVQCLDRSNALAYLKKNGPEETAQFINNFCTHFNTQVVTLKIVTNPPFPEDQAQFFNDSISDAKRIVGLLQRYLDDHPIIEDLEKEQIELRMNQFKEIASAEEEKQEQEESLDRLIPTDEFNSRIKSLTKYAVKHNDFEFQKVIGQGGYADVYLGKQHSTNKAVAIKKLKVDNFTEENLRMYIREVSIIGELKHFAILPFIGVTTTHPYCLVTEFMSGGCLFQRIHKPIKPLDGTKRTIIALGIAYAMAYMHEKNFIHRDLKTLNILLDENDFPMVCDFGISRMIPSAQNDFMTGCIGTAQWMAPEVMLSEQYSLKADVYSYGIILWELLSDDIPFRGLVQAQVLINVASKAQRPMIPPGSPPSLVAFIKACWHQDPNCRPSFKDLVMVFETGKVSYAGTNFDSVKAYISAVKRKSSKSKSSEPAKSPTRERISLHRLVQQLDNPEKSEQAIKLIVRTMKIDRSIPEKMMQHQDQTISSLIKACSICNSSEMTFNIILIFLELNKVSPITNKILIMAILGLCVNYGTTEMTEIVDFYRVNVPIFSEAKLNVKQLNKLVSFLQSSNISLRVESTNVLELILQSKAYDNLNSLKSILLSVIANISLSSSSIPDLLKPSIDSIMMLIEFEELNDLIITSDIFTSTISIFTSKQKDDSIYISAFKLFNELIRHHRSSFKVEDIKFVINSLTDLLKSLPSVFLVKYIICLASLLQVQQFYNTIRDHPKLVKKIESFLLYSSNDQSIILLLKICYALLEDVETRNVMSSIALSCYMVLLEHENEDVAALAASCLIQSASDMKEMAKSEEVVSFLQKGLSSINSMTLNALRVCGSFATTENGAEFLEKNKLIQPLVNFIVPQSISSENNMENSIAKSALMVASSFASKLPISSESLSLTDSILDLLDSDNINVLTYVIAFLSNVVIHPDAAVSCSKQLQGIVDLFDKVNNDEYLTYEIVNILKRIVTCPEASITIDNKKAISDLFTNAEKHINDNLFSTYLELIAGFVCLQNGSECLASTNLQNELSNVLDIIDKDDYRRIIITSIISHQK